MPREAEPAGFHLDSGQALPEELLCWSLGADGLVKTEQTLPRPAAFMSCQGARWLGGGTHPSPPHAYHGWRPAPAAPAAVPDLTVPCGVAR